MSTENHFPQYPGIALKWHPMTNGIVPEEVRRLFIRFLQDYFKSSNNELYMWDPDPQRTKVLVGGVDMNIEDTDSRPLVMVAFNGGSWMGVYKDQYIQDFAVKNPKTNDFYRMPDGRVISGQLFSDTFKGSITCICRDRETRASSLANKVFMALTVYKDVMRYVGMFDVGLPRMSKEFPVKADVKELITEVRVDIDYMLNMRWSITPHDPSANDRGITLTDDETDPINGDDDVVIVIPKTEC